MAVIQPIGQTSGQRQPYSGGNVIKPLSDFNQPILQRQQQTQPTIVQNTQPEKKKGFLSDLSVKKTANYFWEGLKQFPNQVKQGGGVILQGLVSQQRFIDNFYSKSPKLIKPLLSGVPVFQGSAMREAVTGNAESPVNKVVEDYGKKIREEGTQKAQEQSKKFAETVEPSQGMQRYIEMVAYNLPQVLTTTGLTIATTIATKNPALATAVGLSTSYGLGASEVYSDARSSGLSDEQALPLAQWGGAIIGAIDFIPLERLISKTGAIEPVKDSIIKKVASGIVSLGTQSGLEGLTEGTQEIVGNAIQSTYNENQDIFEGVTDAMVVGALLGGLSDVTLQGLDTVIKDSPENIETQIKDALEKSPEERTTQEQEIVDALLTQDFTPEEAVAYVVAQDISETTEGKQIVKQASLAKQTGQNLQVTVAEGTGNLDIKLIQPNEVVTKSKEIATEDKINQPTARENQAQGELPQTQPGKTKVEEAVVENIPEDLAVEAKKFKSAEEFISFYENKTKDFEFGDVKTDASKFVESFTTFSQQPAVQKIYTEGGNDTQALRLLYDTVTKTELPQKSAEIKKSDRVEEGSKTKEKETEAKKKKSKKQKRVGEEKKTRKETKVKEKKRAKSVPRDQLPQGAGKKKVSRLEARVRRVLENVTEDQQKELGLATYKQLSKKENIKKAVEFVKSNPEDAMKILTGEIDAPKGILRNSIYVAMEQLAKGDLALARRLASLQATRFGQEISILTELDPDSAVKVMRDIIQIREKAFAKRFKNRTTDDVKAEIVKEIDQKIKTPSKADWSSFLNEIEC